jgi:hypothetical protein
MPLRQNGWVRDRFGFDHFAANTQAMGSFRIFRLLPVGGESRGQNGFGGFVNGFAGFVFEAVLLKAKDLVASFRKFIFARKTADVVPTASLGTWRVGNAGTPAWPR